MGSPPLLPNIYLGIQHLIIFPSPAALFINLGIGFPKNFCDTAFEKLLQF